MALDEYNKLRLLYVYATSNRNKDEVSMWQKIYLYLDEKGIHEKNMYLSKEQLKQFLIVKNPYYVPGIYKNHVDFTKC